jgi:hypothetical protein
MSRGPTFDTLSVEPRPQFARVAARRATIFTRLWNCLIRSREATDVGNADAEKPSNFFNENAQDFECRIHGIAYGAGGGSPPSLRRQRRRSLIM